MRQFCMQASKKPETKQLACIRVAFQSLSSSQFYRSGVATKHKSPDSQQNVLGVLIWNTEKIPAVLAKPWQNSRSVQTSSGLNCWCWYSSAVHISALGWDLTASAPRSRTQGICNFTNLLPFFLLEKRHDLSSKKRLPKPAFLPILFHLDLGTIPGNFV